MLRFLAVLLCLASPTLAQSGDTTDARQILAHAKADKKPVVVELFTSQGCSSCPPAEALLRDLAENPDVIALEWHVDYWNDLTLRYAGRWVDPFSSPAYTARQRSYNRRIRDRNSVYTPQIIVNGVEEGVGSNRSDVRNMMSTAPALAEYATIDLRRENGALKVDATSSQNADIVLVRFKQQTSTDVEGGENKGRVLASAHVVTAFNRVADLTAGTSSSVNIEMPDTGHNCAVLIQEKGQGRILDAAYCSVSR